MKDGAYSLCFSAASYSGRGHMNVNRQTITGWDGAYRVTGHVTETGHKLAGNLHVNLDPKIIGNSRLEKEFVLPVTGTSDDRGFVLVGLGPLGIIIQLECGWQLGGEGGPESGMLN